MKEALKHPFTPFSAAMIAEGEQEADSREHYIAAWQYLIDTGLAWRLQGWFGRRANELIDAGECYVEQVSQ